MHEHWNTPAWGSLCWCTRLLAGSLWHSIVLDDLASTTQQAWDGGYKANFLCSVIFQIIQHCQSTCYMLNITFIFDRCHRNSATVTPVKYKCDSKNLRGIFSRSKSLLMEKLANGALVTPTFELNIKVVCFHNSVWSFHWIYNSALWKNSLLMYRILEPFADI